MKKIYVLASLALTVNAFAQFAIAGVPGIHYYNINPDTLLDPSYHYNCVASSCQDIYYIDINQDGINDIKITAYWYSALGGNGQGIEVSSLNSSTLFSYGKTDSTHIGYNNTWITTDILSMFSGLDTIKNGIFKPSSYLTSYSQSQGTTSTSSEWINRGDKYFGVKFSTATDTTYGWVKVNITGYSSGLIKEFSLGVPLSGIKQFTDNEEISIYPNPNNGLFNLTISQFDNGKTNNVEVYNTIGECVHRQIAKSSNCQIDVSDLAEGIYNISINSNEGVVNKRLVIVR